MKGAKHTFVGNFFEQVAHGVLGGDLTRNDDGDLNLWKTNTTVEVKSSGNRSSYGFRLSVEQIGFYKALECFPFDQVWYIFFSYRNGNMKGEDGNRHSELSRYNDQISINRYLAESVQWCTLVDFSIVKGWMDSMPHSTKSVMGHLGLETVDLKPASVHQIANGGFKEGLEGINLNPASYVRVAGQIKMSLQPDLFNEYNLSFPLTAVLSKVQSRPFRRMLKKRGFHLLEKTV